MKLHNEYTLQSKHTFARAYNTVAADFRQKAATHVPWAKYFCLGDSTGACLFVPATLRFIHSDPAQGGTFKAQYEGQCDGVAGKTYTSVSLCHSASADAAVSTATVAYEGTGEEITLTAIIYLELTQDDNVRLCAGDNPLIRLLLGCGTTAPWRIGWGSCTLPAEVCDRTTEGLTGIEDATVQADGTGIHMRISANTAGDELVLYAGNKSAVRALRPFSHNLRAVQTTATGSSVRIGNRPERIFNVRINDSAYGNIDTLRIVDKAVTVTSDHVRDLGAAGAVYSDPAGEYIAFAAASYVEVYKVDVVRLTLVLRVPKTDEIVTMCRGGALALWAPYQLDMYVPDENGAYSKFGAAVPRGAMRVVVRDGDVFHAAYRNGRQFARYKVSATECTQLASSTVSAQFFLLGRCGDAIFTAEKQLKVYTVSTERTEEFAASSLGRNYLRVCLGTGDFFALSRENNTTYIYDFVHGTFAQTEAGLTANGRLLYNQTNAYVYDHCNGVTKLGGSYDLTDCTGACIAGDGLFVVRDGKLYTYYLNGSDLSLRLPAGSEGSSVFYNVRERLLQGENAPVAFKLE